jgi:monoamine oxidase
MSDIDVAVVGAGAAGVAAARRLAVAGLKALLIEAGSRIGGRAWTHAVGGLPLDLGCAWLHSADRNPWTRLAEELGFTVDRTPPPWGRQAGDRGFTREEQAAAGAAYDAFDERLRKVPPASDRASDALPAEGPWNHYVNSLSGYINGADLNSLSVADYIAYDDADSGRNWRVVEGYGALVAQAAAGLDVRLGCMVDRIDAGGRLLAIETSSGRIEAKAAIVTVSTAMLAAGRPGLPKAFDPAREAAGRLPLGLADKLVLTLDDPGLAEPDTQVMGDPRAAHAGTYHLRPFGRPVIEGFFGGGCAEALDRDGEAAMAAFARDELAALFGDGIRGKLRPLAASRWRREPHVGGSYSHALPGHRQAREALAERRDGRILLAGEACSAQDFSTAHGAYATGAAAAEALIASLRKPLPA